MTNTTTTRLNSCAPIGLEIFKELTNKTWLVQPKQSLEVFKQTPCRDAFWKTGKATWRYDKHSAYLACASSVKCGVGEYELRSDLRSIDEVGLCPGLCLVDVSENDSERTRGLLLPGMQWQYTPLVRWARDHAHVLLAIQQAYVWPEYHSVFQSFYKALKDCRQEDEQAAKWLYRKTFGMLSHWPQRYGQDMRYLPKGYVYRPDWYNLLRAELKARMYYHAWQVWQAEGIWPVSMVVDELGYDRQIKSLRLGDGIGAFRERQV